MENIIPGYISFSFVVLVLVVLIFILIHLNKASKKSFDPAKAKRIFSLTTFVLGTWLLLLLVISKNNILNNYSATPPRMLIAILPPLIAVIGLSFSKSILQLLDQIKMEHLIYLQTFRVAVELVLWMLYRNNIIPIQMSFEGRNYDVLVGLSALFTGYYYAQGIEFFKRKWFLISWNIAGLVILANIVVIAILSTPLPFRQFMNEPANTVIFYFPFVWLPGFLVPVAYTLHFFSLRKLLAIKS